MQRIPTGVLVLITLLFTMLLAGCGGGRVPEEFRTKAKLETWSDAEWATVLNEVATEDGFVEWNKLKNNKNGVRDALYRYVGQIGAASPRNRRDLFPTGTDRIAYYINAYNALAMYGVIQRGYPSSLRVTSLDPGGLYQIDKFRVGGKNTTLNGLERVEIRGRSGNDPRIHFAVNCMAFSCPPLRREPYTGDKLVAQLNEQGQIYLSDPRAAVKKNEKTVGLNSIFTTYYEAEFRNAAEKRTGENRVGLLDAVKFYAAQDSPVQSASDVDDMGYDWSLNYPPEQWPPQK